ncbi:hypothetical protein J132_09546 [Termitomyces sp. J132]|nr:hypothetical protein J132_09546 [Termitomyces sp. J132]
MPTPTSANSDTSPANSDGPLANFGACPAATDTYPGLPEPRKPPPLFLIFVHPSLTPHPASSDLFRNITTTSEQPAIPSTYQRGTIFDHNRHPPTPSSPAKPRRHSRRTPKSSGSQYISHRVALRTPVLILLNVTYGMCQLHPVFNVVKLTLAPKDPIPGQCSPLPPLPVVVNNSEEYEVEEILDSCLFQRQLQYKVKWKGYRIEDISWKPQENMHAPGLIKEFHRRHPDALCAIRGIYPISPADQQSGTSFILCIGALHARRG